MQPKRQIVRIAVAAMALIMLQGCQGPAFETGVKWDPKESRFFDDGVDLIKDLSALSGSFGYERTNEFEGRAHLADFVAEVRVLSVQVSTDLEGRESRRIDVNVVNAFYGESPQQRFVLDSDKESSGHALIVRHESHLLEEKFLLFVRWFEDRDDEDNRVVGHHFHLTLDTDKTKTALKELVKARIREEQATASGQGR